ncbi:MAG: hypothetical protein R3B91_13740 [Planctomycetaceae bacterium]
MLKALGFPARAVLVVMAVGLSVWGLKELIAYQWSETVRRPVRARSNRFMMPVEGMIYCVIMLVLLSGSVIGRSQHSDARVRVHGWSVHREWLGHVHDAEAPVSSPNNPRRVSGWNPSRSN